MSFDSDPTILLNLCIAGHLDPHWEDWFEGLEMSHLADGNTKLSGTVEDQAALYGLLSRARDLGLTLLSVSAKPAGEDTTNNA